MPRVHYHGTIPSSGEYFPKNSWLDVSKYHSVGYGLITDGVGTVTIEFSPDQRNVDSTLTQDIAANTREVHVFKRFNSFMRIKFTATTAPVAYFRMEVFNDEFTQVTSNINSTMQGDADGTIVRPLDFNIMVAEGLYQNRSNTVKDGYNDDIRSGTVPEDVWGDSGTYAGFPTAATEEGQIVVAGNDTMQLEARLLLGLGTMIWGHNIYRCNYIFFQSSSATAFNVGDITLRWKTTTATIFAVIKTGIGQSYCGAYTVPYGSTIFIDRITATVRGANSASLDGYFWYRPYSGSPYLRFPFQAQFGSLYFDDIDYLIRIPQQVDFVPRVTASNSANASAVSVSYRLLKVRA